jgi:hypothetical protein
MRQAVEAIFEGRAGAVEWSGGDPCGRPGDSQTLPPFQGNRI